MISPEAQKQKWGQIFIVDKLFTLHRPQLEFAPLRVLAALRENQTQKPASRPFAAHSQNTMNAGKDFLVNADKGGFTQMKTFKPNLRIIPQNPETLSGYTLRIYRVYAFDLICVQKNDLEDLEPHQ
ncbi:hypothetical protein GFER_16595 [Geoalkalibacter ferrihydriticus DSM 17813]|uniref:Uncharacterized protein n=1 Tax=Geoalkalibacter ferrihydriticus DSM 17813 TaxID=1121915 RepID=A0A0C2HEM9_9BACT|nr:hypothetical protein [Geoalkalibacter ferrihydriticus]KIH75406.1 hypothetical protein GFER_16595 [Geoalkalibacter ferrihydriticus DSM 17813]